MRARILAAACALVLTACGATAHLLGASVPTPVPWIDAKPTPIPTPPRAPTPPGTTYCRGTDLDVALGHSQGLTNGQVEGAVALTNRASVACFLKGHPQIWLLDAQGTILPIEQRPLPMREDGPVLLPPGGHAWVALGWRTHDGGGTCSSPPPPVRAIRMDVAGQTVTLPVDDRFAPYGLTPCGWAVGVTEYQGPSVESPPPLPPLNLAATLALPKTVRAGDVVNYRVTLRNVAGSELVFGTNCPAYVQVVSDPTGEIKAKEVYLLNCQPVGVIPAGAAITFVMRYALPTEAPVGRYMLDWALIGSPPKAGISTATFTVTR